MVDQRPDSSAHIVFGGTDADEAESFILAIRQLAYDENKDDDNAWMARFATTCFRGRAMRWHARLDATIRRDWDLLVQAILDEWPIDGTRDDGQRNPVSTQEANDAPTPAIVPPGGTTELSPFARGHLCVGRIRIAPDNSRRSPLYVHNPRLGPDAPCCALVSANDTSHFQMIISDSPSALITANAHAGYGCYSLAMSNQQLLFLPRLDGQNPANQDANVWTMDGGGVLRATWTEQGSATKSTTEFAIPLHAEVIRPWADPDVPPFNNPQITTSHYKARLVFELL